LGGVPLLEAAGELELEYVYIGEPEPSFKRLLQAALGEQWAVALVMAAQAEAAICACHPEAAAGFIRMDNLLHSVVLIGVEGDSVVYLDPYYPLRYQPVRMPWRQFADAWRWGLVWV